ncbi:MAG TPA: TonB-dependent receptor plug domain-containing protein, partial [Myxococcaceae bacterium]|nr:TonB-dependent receptor plug domain-containing protein [Myxococcaceae bacterium]
MKFRSAAVLSAWLFSARVTSAQEIPESTPATVQAEIGAGPSEPAAPSSAPAENAEAPTPTYQAVTSGTTGSPEPKFETLVVGTSEARTSGSAHVIRSEALERYEQDDAHAVLKMVPGVYARGEDGLGLRPNIGIRGSNSDRSKKITLTEDGVLFAPSPYSAPAAYYFPLFTRMEQVRVLKGP